MGGFIFRLAPRKVHSSLGPVILIVSRKSGGLCINKRHGFVVSAT